MARPERHDADYFPFIVKDGRTLFVLQSKYGLQGIGFFTNLMRFLTRQSDHHIHIKDESDRLYFFAQLNCPDDIGMDMLELMSKTGKVDRSLWQENQVIVSADLLESLKDAYKNRKNKIITMEEIRASYQPNPITYAGNTARAVFPGRKEGHNPQTKLKETKLKERKNIVTTPEAKELVTLLFQKIKARKPDLKEPNLEAWAVEADRMMRIDGREFENAKSVIEWCQADSFWKNNVLSMEKVRKHFDTLELQKKEKSNGTGRSGGENRGNIHSEKPAIYPVDVE